MKENLKRTLGPAVEAYSPGIKVHIEKSAWKNMYGWCRAATTEVSGLGLATLHDGVFTVSRVFFPEQMCSRGYTELIKDGQSRLINHLTMKHLAKFDNDAIKMIESGEKAPGELLKFWWHTHYDFNTFWSGTDDDNAAKLAVNNGDWSLSLVINQKGDWLCRADFVNPLPITIDKLPVELIDDSQKYCKPNYKSDIRRWVKPLPVLEKKIIHLPRIIQRLSQKEYSWSEPRKINYAGMMVTEHDFQQLEACSCPGNICPDCKFILNKPMWARE